MVVTNLESRSNLLQPIYFPNVYKKTRSYVRILIIYENELMDKSLLLFQGKKWPISKNAYIVRDTYMYDNYVKINTRTSIHYLIKHKNKYLLYNSNMTFSFL